MSTVLEKYANVPQLLPLVVSGGTDVVTAGTQQSWTLSSAAGLAAASNTASPPYGWYGADPAAPSEVFFIANLTGTAATVIRGADGTTPVAHKQGFELRQIAPAGSMARWTSARMRRVYVDDYGADATGTADSAAAFQAALADLPTMVFNNGTSQATYHVGTIVLGSGTYKLGTGADVGNLGPFVSVIGPGRDACRLDYHGSGDCLRVFNTLRPAGSTAPDFVNMFNNASPYGNGGQFEGFIIDGVHAGAGAAGLHLGDFEGSTLGPDLLIQNFAGAQIAAPTGLSATAVASGGTFAAGTYFWVITALTRTGETTISNEASVAVVLNGKVTLNWTAVAGATGYRVYRGTATGGETTMVTQVAAVTTYSDTGTAGITNVAPLVNTSGATGLWLDNTVAWTENHWGRVILWNNSNAVVMDGCNGASAGPSFGYNDFTFKVYVRAGQNGVVVRGGASLYNGSLRVRGNFEAAGSAQTAAALIVHGYCQTIGNSHAGASSSIFNEELDYQVEADNGLNTHQTINFGFPGGPSGNVIIGCTGKLCFSGFSNNTNGTQPGKGSQAVVKFDGIVVGDSALNPGSNQSAPITVGARRPGIGYYNAASANVRTDTGDLFSWTLTGNITVVLANGQGSQRMVLAITQATSTGPFTVTWPAGVVWAAGAAPVMTPVASATDVYFLETFDGTTWYGHVSRLSNAPGPSQSGLVATNYDPAAQQATGGLAVNGSIYMMRVDVAQTVRVAAVKWYQTVAGATPTAGQNLAGIYDASGTQKGTVVVDAQVSVTGLCTGTFASAVTLTPGSYYIVLLFNATTPPTIGRASSLLGQANAATAAPSLRFSVLATLQTALPATATMAGQSVVNAFPFWIGLA